MAISITVKGCTDVGLVRTNNEDAFTVMDLDLGRPQAEGTITIGARGGLLAVSDGMGGHKAGEVASEMTIEALLEALAADAPARNSAEFDDRLAAAAITANHTVFEAAQRPSRANMGATLTAVLVERTYAHILQVGDSRAYVIRGGKAFRLTRDQNLAQALVDTKTLSDEEAALSPFKNLLLQAVGLRDSLSVGATRLSLRAGDTLLVCSDGLNNHITDREIPAIAGSGEVSATCDRLVQLAKERGGTDNITVVLARVTGDLPPLDPMEAFGDTFRVLQTFHEKGTARSVAVTAASHRPV